MIMDGELEKKERPSFEYWPLSVYCFSFLHGSTAHSMESIIAAVLTYSFTFMLYHFSFGIREIPDFDSENSISNFVLILEKLRM